MPSRIAAIHGSPTDAAKSTPAVASSDLLIAWTGEHANVSARLGAVCAPSEPVPPAAVQDLLDIATALYAADIAVMRGEREAWTREIELAIPVRLVDLWDDAAEDLRRLTYELSRDTFHLVFYESPQAPSPGCAAAASPGFDPDCVCTLSGGLDSLAGAVMLQETGRRPVWSLHRSGNPAVRTAQELALAAVERHWPGRSAARPCIVEPNPRGEAALPYPPPEKREPSRRCRSLLFMALALATAEAVGVDEVYMPENGILTAGLPLVASRAGSSSTHSTHPSALKLMNAVAERAGMRARISNPFVYQTKSELIRDILAPNLSIAEIQSTASCWAVGRANRQCGGCIPCLLRQIGMAWAELPPEAYMLDPLSRPSEYVGTDAYGNVVDMLRQAERASRMSEAEMIVAQPELLSLHAAGVDVDEVATMFKRHARQTLTVIRDRYPAALDLIF